MKKIISILLSTVLALSIIAVVPFSAGAEENEAYSIKFDKNLKEKFNDSDEDEKIGVSVWIVDIDEDILKEKTDEALMEGVENGYISQTVANAEIAGMLGDTDTPYADIATDEEIDFIVHTERVVAKQLFEEHNAEVFSELFPDPDNQPEVLYISCYAPNMCLMLTKSEILEIAESDLVVDLAYTNMDTPLLEDGENSESIIYCDPSVWGDDYSYIFAHVWRIDGNGSWLDWESKDEICTLEEDGRWSFDLLKTGNNINFFDDDIYCVIFATDTGLKTDVMFMNGRFIGNTVVVTDEISEEYEETAYKAFWENAEDSESIIYCDPSAWGDDYSYIFAHVWRIDGNGSWLDWGSSDEICTLEEDGRWSFDLSKTGNNIDCYDDDIYCVIFSTDTGLKTESMRMNGSFIGNTVVVTDEISEDYEEPAYKAYWENTDNIYDDKYYVHYEFDNLTVCLKLWVSDAKVYEKVGKYVLVSSASAGATIDGEMTGDYFINYEGVLFSIPDACELGYADIDELHSIFSDPESELYNQIRFYQTGDVNGDDILDVNDATCAQKQLAGYTDAGNVSDVLAYSKIADFNGDGIVDVNDVTAIQMNLAGYYN